MVQAINQAQVHRGPDEGGMHLRDGCGLAMTRLSIIDVEGGHQPIFSDSRQQVLVGNGEIYNHRELRSELENGGAVFSSHSDIEVVLHGYEKHGVDIFSILNGMFAIALYDANTHRLVLARDPFGQKPLYYYQSEKGILFASEIKALKVALADEELKIDEEGILQYLWFRYVPNPRTAYSEIKMLPPGHYLVAEGGEVRIAPYFEPRWGSLKAQTPQALRDQLRAAVHRHLMSERPVGLFLSGGLDSSALLHFMSEVTNDTIHTFSVGFEGFKENETGFAAKVAEKYNTDHHELILDPETCWNLLDEVIFALDDPLVDLSTVALYALTQKAKEHIVVILSGEGSDELFMGYQSMDRRIADLRRAEVRSNRLNVWKRIPSDKWAGRLASRWGGAFDYLYYRPFLMTRVFEDTQLLHQEIDLNRRTLEQIALAPYREYLQEHKDWDPVNVMVGANLRWWLSDNLLQKADKITMAHSLEIRSPFLDTELAQFALHLPDQQKIGLIPGRKGVEKKALLKQAMQGLLPDDIIFQSKKGFVIPFYEWLVTVWKDRVGALLERAEFIDLYIPKSKIKQLWVQAQEGQLQAQHQIWSLVVLEKWHNVFHLSHSRA